MSDEEIIKPSPEGEQLADTQDVVDSKEVTFPYPQHSESFECYYWLGERRTLRETAIIRFRALVPDCPSTDPRFPTKFSSFYTKIKRWAKKEAWNEWIKRKDFEERVKQEEEIRTKVVQSQKNILGYRSLLQQGLFGFSRRVSKTTRLVNTLMQLDERIADPNIPEGAKKALEEAKSKLLFDIKSAGGVEIKNFKEASECIQLDLELGKILRELPAASSTDKVRLEEEKAERIDQIFEFFRRHSRDRVKKVEVVESEETSEFEGEEVK
jgi:hypothetical protein